MCYRPLRCTVGQAFSLTEDLPRPRSQIPMGRVFNLTGGEVGNLSRPPPARYRVCSTVRSSRITITLICPG